MEKGPSKTYRKKNPDIGMEWALAINQSKKGSNMLKDLIVFANVLKEKGFNKESETINQVAARGLTNVLPMKINEVITNPVFKLSIEQGDFQAAKDIALNTIMQASDVEEKVQQKMLYNIENIETAELDSDVQKVAKLQKYLYDAWLYHGGMSPNATLEGLIKVADQLDEKGLVTETDELDKLISEAFYISQQEIQRIAPSRERRHLSRPFSSQGEEGSICPKCKKPIFTTNIPCPDCGYVDEQKENIEEV